MPYLVDNNHSSPFIFYKIYIKNNYYVIINVFLKIKRKGLRHAGFPNSPLL